LGIFVNVAGLKQEDFNTLVNENNHDAVINHAQGGHDIATKPGIYFPYQHYFSYFAIPWANWYWRGSLEEEPSAPAQEQMQLYNQVLATSDPDKVSDSIDQILAIAEEEFYVMGICPAPDIYALVKSNFHNVPMTMPYSFSYPTPAPTNPCQYFIDPQG
jgi:peptide/nickel transport system substrate-binding protein